MEPTRIFIQFLQSSIAPIALISGVGLILLSLTNRLGRTIDRSRQLINELKSAEQHRRNVVLAEIAVLHRRNRYLKTAMAGIAFSILTSSLMIPVLLLMNVSSINLSYLGSFLLILSIGGIIVSAIFLFADVSLTLKALELEMKNISDSQD
jgi:hypothetical protein